MFSSYVAARKKAACAIICVSLGLLAAPLSAQQIELPDEIDVVGGNSSNSRVFWLNYDATDPALDAAIQVNTDASSYPNLNSFTFFRNTCGAPRADVIGASTNASLLPLYVAGRGAGESICSGGSCPQRPDGLSTSNDHTVISVASTGAGGSTPAIWLFRPSDCVAAGADGAEKATFARSGGQPFSVTGARAIAAIADTEFVRADAGGLEEGDLLVLTSSPPMIARLTKAQVAAGDTAVGTELVGPRFFGKATPTGMAFAPGDEATLLVTLSGGPVLSLPFPFDGSKKLASYALAGPAGLFSNPRGIAAGTRAGAPYIIVADQNKGQFIRAGLATNDSGLFIPSDATRAINSPVGAPQGVAILPEEVEEEEPVQECVDRDPDGTGTTGCILLNTIQVHLSQGYEEGGLQGGEKVTAELISFDDMRHPNQDIPLGLPAPFEHYSVPSSCRGFPVDGETYPQIVLLDMGLNFEITPGNFIQVTELASRLLQFPEDADTCDVTGSRIYYHPETEAGGTLFDTTFSCQNPSRSIVERFSPVAFCADPVYLARIAEPNLRFAIEIRREDVNDEIRERLAVLKGIISELNADSRFASLANELNGYVTGRSNPQSSWPQKRYLEASEAADNGALAVFNAKQDLKASAIDGYIPDDTYARLLSRFLSLAFYNWSTGALADAAYAPPAPFCQQPTPELPDVVCRAP
jgi:hypothetical protein